MATIVSTGQITIVDNNDAKPITAYITASNGTQQVYTKDDSTSVFLPDWSSANNILTAKIFAGSTVDIASTAQITNKKWSTDLSTSIGTSHTYTVNTNFTTPDTTSSKTYYFECDYVDPGTSLVTHIIAQITLNVVKTGTNATYVITRGITSIEESSTATKNVAIVAADLVRSSGVDTTNVSYKFFEATGSTSISNNAPFTTKYGLKTISYSTNITPSSGSSSDIGQNLPTTGATSVYNTIIISESAVVDMGVYKVEVFDDENSKSYVSYFTIYDVSDPYETKVVSTAGDKMQNGVGSTNLYPRIFYGSSELSTSDTSAWTFKWSLYDTMTQATGLRAGFIDTTRTGVSGRSISDQSGTAPNVVFTYGGAAIAFTAGDLIKVVDPSTSKPWYLEVASGSGNTVTVRAPQSITWLSGWPPASITANQFLNGKLYVCSGTGVNAGLKTSTGTGLANAITVTGDDIDVKGNIIVESSRP